MLRVQYELCYALHKTPYEVRQISVVDVRHLLALRELQNERNQPGDE